MNLIGSSEMIKEMLTGKYEQKATDWSVQLKAANTIEPEVCLFTAGGIPIVTDNGIYPPNLILPRDSSVKKYNEAQEADVSIVFELDGWRIENYTNHTDCDELDWISHYCEDFKWRFRIDPWQLVGEGVCSKCFEEIPEEVLGVWKLKHFDMIAKIEVELDLDETRTVLLNPLEDEGW